MGCANPRCPVKYWPYDACGDQCPFCKLSGYHKGIGVHDGDPLAEPADEDD